MAQEKGNHKGNKKGKSFSDKRTFNPPGGGAQHESQEQPQDKDQEHRMGQWGQTGDHPRDTGRGNRHQ